MSNLPINSPIKGPGLTKPGVVILQFLVIFLFEAVEILFRNSLGIITCLAIWIAFPATTTAAARRAVQLHGAVAERDGVQVGRLGRVVVQLADEPPVVAQRLLQAARLEQRKRAVAQRAGRRGLQRHGAARALDRVAVAAQVRQQVAAPAQAGHKVGRARQRRVEARERLLQPAQRLERDAPVVQRVHVQRRRRERRVVGRDRLARAPHALVRRADVGEQRRAHRRGARTRPVCHVFGGRLQRLERARPRGQRGRVVAARKRGVRGVELRGAHVRAVELRGVELRGVELRGVELRGVELRGPLRPSVRVELRGPCVCLCASVRFRSDA